MIIVLLLILILTYPICVYSSHDWEKMVDTLDHFILNSFLVIQCNHKEIQIIHRLKSLDQIRSNLQCTNKEDLLPKKSTQMQLGNCSTLQIKCPKKKSSIQTDATFDVVEKSTSEMENKEGRPYVHTFYTQIENKKPIKMKFDKKRTISLSILAKSNYTSHFEYLIFVNRPLICRILIANYGNLCEKETVSWNPPKPFECYYKFRSSMAPSHEEFVEVIDAAHAATKGTKGSLYFPNGIELVTLTDNSNDADLTSATLHSVKSTLKSNETSFQSFVVGTIKDNSTMTVGIVVVTLLVITIAIVFIYRKQRQRTHLVKQSSDSSIESTASTNSIESH